MTLHVPAAKVHDVALNVPVLLLVKLTVPVGVTAPAPEESATVTVQVLGVLSRNVLGVLSRTLAGEHDTLVALARRVEARLNVPLLPVWTLSPAYVPVINE